MKVTIIIPARFKSTRFPGKPLVKLNCPGGKKKSLINLTWEAARKVRGVDDIFVATDDERISNEVKEFGGKVLITSETCRNGTERCAEATRKINPENGDLVINIQGDAPLTPPWFVEKLINEMTKSDKIDVATPILKFDETTYKAFKKNRKNGVVGGTTVTFDIYNNALFFSKEMIPFQDLGSKKGTENLHMFHHVGVYAYRTKALEAYFSLPEGPLEKIEGLEQLRFLENGMPVKCVEVEGRGKIFWELNNPEDVDLIEALLSKE